MAQSAAEKTMSDIIDDHIRLRISEIPYPMRCKITKVYSNNTHADISCDLGDLTYVECIANNLTVGNTGLLVFLNGSTDDCIVITK